MKTRAEIEEDAEKTCPYVWYHLHHIPWVEGYVAVAIKYEAKLDALRRQQQVVAKPNVWGVGSK